MNNKIEDLIDKATAEITVIIESSKTREECYDRLVEWLGFKNSFIDKICDDFDKKKLDKLIEE